MCTSAAIEICNNSGMKSNLMSQWIISWDGPDMTTISDRHNTLSLMQPYPYPAPLSLFVWFIITHSVYPAIYGTYLVYCIYIYLLANTQSTEFWQSPLALFYDDKWCNGSLNIIWCQSTCHCHCWAHDFLHTVHQYKNQQWLNQHSKHSLLHKFVFSSYSVSQPLFILRGVLQSPEYKLDQSKIENVLLVPT